MSRSLFGERLSRSPARLPDTRFDGASRPRRRIRAVVVGGLLLVAAACGSTLPTRAGPGPVTEGVGGSGGAGGSVGGSASAPGAAGVAGSAASSGGANGGVAGPLNPGGVSGTGGVGGGASASPGAAAAVPTAGPLKIGLPIMSSCTGSCAAGNNSLGLKGIGTGATGGTGTQAQWQLLLDDVNARGGLFGRKLVPVFYTPDTQNGTQGEQAACTLLTQDNKVFAGVFTMAHTPLIVACLQKAGVIALQLPGYMTSDATAFTQNPHFFVAGGLNLTRLATAYVDGLFDQGFFDSTAKIGLVAWDTPEHNRAAEVLKQALARHGLALTADVRTAPTYGVGDASSAASENQNAVLHFRAAGVNRVLFLGIGGSPGFFFVTAAQAQNYYPRYGLTSNDLPESLRQQANAMAFKGAAGVGWWPAGDVTEPQPLSAAAERCKALTGRTGDLPAYSACDALDILVQAAIAGGSAMSADSIITGLQGLPPIAPSTMIQLKYGPGRRRDGVAVARHFAYIDSCSCLRYTSGVYPLP